MGYTHYWERQRVLPLRPFRAAVEDCRGVCAGLPIPLGDAQGQGEPEFSPKQICFNGHVDSGTLSSVQKAEGLIWPTPGARGIAVIGEGGAAKGSWGAGPQANARVLGPSGDGSYETFHIERIIHCAYPEQERRGGFFSALCKTNYRPYDLCVQCCLIVLNHHLGSETFRVTSDGTSAHWNDARDACQHVLGYGIDWGEDKLAPVEPQPQGGQP